MEVRLARLDDLRDGAAQRARAADREVTVVRLGDDVRVMPAECPHYHGPLPDGVLHEGRLVCPWHQAIFSVRDGDLLEPPSFFALPTWPVRLHAGEVWVDIPDEAPGQRTPPMTPPDPSRDGRLAVLVGAGGAAAAAAESLRQEGFSGRIVMVGPERRPPYDRPNCSKDLLAGTMKPAWMPLRSEKFYEKWGVERRYDSVTSLDVASGSIELHDGEQLTPDLVLIATGGVPRQLTVDGGGGSGVFTLRSWDDCEAIVAASEGARHAVVAGASFIGMEVAVSLRRRGLGVTVVAPEPEPLARAFGAAIGTQLRRLHEQHGVAFRLGRTIAAIDGGAGVREVHLDDGDTLPADLVVAGLGVRPATDFVRGAPIDQDGGVSVDEQLRLGDSGRVWAAGDIARFPAAHLDGDPVRIEHWRLALQHGRAAARCMLGSEAPFAAVPFFWTQQHGLRIGFTGYGHAYDEILLAGDLPVGDFVAYYLHGAQVHAAAGTRTRQLAAFAELMRCGRLPAADEFRSRPDMDLVAVLTH